MTIGEMDALLFTAIHGGSGAPAAAVMTATLVAKVLIYLLPVHMVALWVRGDDVRRQTALVLLGALICGIAMSYLIGLGFHRMRPFLAGLGDALMSHRPSASFPSNHALVFSAYASTLLLLRRFRLGVAVLVAGLMVGAARVYLGVHYPGDILGGFLLGPVAALISLSVSARWGTRLYRMALSVWERFALVFRRLVRAADTDRDRRYRDETHP